MMLIGSYYEDIYGGLYEGMMVQFSAVYSEDGEEITNFTLPFYGEVGDSFEEVVEREYKEHGYSETLNISIEDCSDERVDFSADPRVLEYLVKFRDKLNDGN